jgi:hypothetical protein
MDEIERVMNNMMGFVMFNAVQVMWATFVQDMIRADRERLTKALGHEPTDENWQDYYDLLKEQKTKQKTSQREADKGKLRRLVMGEGDATFNTR